MPNVLADKIVHVNRLFYLVFVIQLRIDFGKINDKSLDNALNNYPRFFCRIPELYRQIQGFCWYKLKKYSNKECCKQCRYVMFKDTMTKWRVQKLIQETTQKLLQHHDVTDIQKNYIFVFSDFYFLFIDNFLNEFSKKCWVTALVRSMTFIGSLNHFLNIPWRRKRKK